MPWCPKCKLEFREGFEVCSDCQSDLVREIELAENQQQHFHNYKEVFLVNVANQNEADILESILESNGIPIIRKYKASSSYLNIYMGMSNMGIDLCVSDKDFKKATEIINDLHSNVDEDIVYEKMKKDITINRRRRIFILIIIMNLPIIIKLVLDLIKSVN